MNHYTCITVGLETTTKVLAPYLCNTLRTHHGDEWWDKGVLQILANKTNLPEQGEDAELIRSLDLSRCLFLMRKYWNLLFRAKHQERYYLWISELKYIRDDWAHKGSNELSYDDAWRALDTMFRVIESLDAASAREIQELKDHLQAPKRVPKVANGEPYRPEYNSLTAQVHELIHRLGVPAHIKGHRYLTEAILMVYKDRSLIGSITKSIYPKIAQLYNTTPSRVERAVRHAIEVSFGRRKGESGEIFTAVFGETMGKYKPVNAEYISTVVNYFDSTMADGA